MTTTNANPTNAAKSTTTPSQWVVRLVAGLTAAYTRIGLHLNAIWIFLIVGAVSGGLTFLFSLIESRRAKRETPLTDEQPTA
jgi:Na+-driven multidrug efflux pump